MLYPLKFTPIYKQRIWGGRKLETIFGKKLPAGSEPIGESWELSGVDGDVSVVTSGALKGNSLTELTEIYMGDLVGDSVFERFGTEFPLLIKLIDANDYLSIQVHPNDALSAARHNSYGKTEMWYVIDNEKGASLYLGFNQAVTKDKYMEYLNEGKLEQLLNDYKVSPDNVFFIPAGAIHAIGKGILIAEIQQTSDITYRVYDFNRRDADGNARELHTELAIDAIDFTERHDYEVTKTPVENSAVELQSCQYFASEITQLQGVVERDYFNRDSFTIYICLEGEASIDCGGGIVSTMQKGDTVLLPAEFDAVQLTGTAKILETWIPLR